MERKTLLSSATAMWEVTATRADHLPNATVVHQKGLEYDASERQRPVQEVSGARALIIRQLQAGAFACQGIRFHAGFEFHADTGESVGTPAKMVRGRDDLLTRRGISKIWVNNLRQESGGG